MRIFAETAERSIVTVLAVDTVNSTGHIAGDDPDDAQELLDRIYEHLDGSVRRAGGPMGDHSGGGRAPTPRPAPPAVPATGSIGRFASASASILDSSACDAWTCRSDRGSIRSA